MSLITGTALTLSTLVFNPQYSDLNGSLRQNFARGTSIPTRLLMRHQDITDGPSGLPARLSSVRFEHVMALTSGAIGTGVSVTVTVRALKDPLVTTSIINDNLTLVNQLLNGATNTNGLGLSDEIYTEIQQ